MELLKSGKRAHSELWFFQSRHDIKLPYDNVLFMVDEKIVFKSDFYLNQDKADGRDVNLDILQKRSVYEKAEPKKSTYEKAEPSNLHSVSPRIKSNLLVIPEILVSSGVYDTVSSKTTQLEEALLQKNPEQYELPELKIAPTVINMEKIPDDSPELPPELKAMGMFRKASHLDLKKEDLLEYKKMPFPVDDWVNEMKEFKTEVVEKLSKQFRVMLSVQANTIHAKQMNVPKWSS